MHDRERNWLNLFGEYTPTETAWHGRWTSYDVAGVATTTRQVVRSFRSNPDNSVITHTNRYINENTDQQSWQLIKATCNQADGVVHPAYPAMRTLSVGKGATAWLRLNVTLGEKFGGELFFRDRNWRSSVVLVYTENGTFSRLIHIREHLGTCSDKLQIEMPAVDRLWYGEKSELMPDLQISPSHQIQKSLDLSKSNDLLTSGLHHRTFLLPQGMVVTIPATVQTGSEFQLAATQFTTDGRCKSLTIGYDAAGAFASLSAEVLQAVGVRI